MTDSNLKQAPVPPSAWIQLGCQLCGCYFWQELKSGDRQMLFCNSCVARPNSPPVHDQLVQGLVVHVGEAAKSKPAIRWWWHLRFTLWKQALRLWMHLR